MRLFSLDVRSVRFSPLRGALLAAVVGGATVLACSSDDGEPATSTVNDAGVEATTSLDPQTGSDAQPIPFDAGRPWPDAPCATHDIGFKADAPPALLSQTGLYSNTVKKTVASGVRSYAPAYTLWSDGAEKNRWVTIPDGCAIDTSDMDHWNMPVGTKFWKEFVVNGKRIETRLVARTGPKRYDYAMVSYAWRADGTDADILPAGITNAQGTNHDIPSSASCLTCHGHLPELILGFGAIELAKGTGFNLDTLVAEKRLSAPPAAPIAVPGDPVVANALGYMHANCGNCHNSDGIQFPDRFGLRLSVNDKKPEDTDVYRTAINAKLDRWCGPGVEHRIAPGEPKESCLSVRPHLRGVDTDSQLQMPPIGTKMPDPAGLNTIDTWIKSLKP